MCIHYILGKKEVLIVLMIQVLKSIEISESGLFLDDTDVISDALWTLSYLSDTQKDDIIDRIAR